MRRVTSGKVCPEVHSGVKNRGNFDLHKKERAAAGNPMAIRGFFSAL